MGQGDSPLYAQVVRITHVYLGPAADRFIARQVQNHLHKAPESLTRTDLIKLIDWIRVAVSLITEDSEIVEEYTAQLRQLTTNPEHRKPPRPSHKELSYGTD